MRKKIRKICPICGAETEKLYDNLCRECYVKSKEFLKIKDTIEAQVCKDCLKYLRKNSWKFVSENYEEVLEELTYALIEDNIKVKEIENSVAEIEILEIDPYNNFCRANVRIYGKIDDIEYKEEKEVEIKVKLVQCKDCARKARGYYESILQIRGANKEELEEIKRVIYENIKNFSREDSKAFVSKEERLKEGLNFYMGSKKVARKIANILKKKYNAVINESKKLYGLKDGKEVYRYTISVRLPKFRIGDILEKDGKYYQIIGISNDIVQLQSIENEEKIKMNLRDVENSRIAAKIENLPKAVVISKNEKLKEVQLMDLERFNTYTIKGEFDINEEVKIFKAGKKIFAIKQR